MLPKGNLVRSVRSRVVIASVLVFAAAVAVSANLDTRSERTRAADWAKAHQQSLPQTLDVFASYPKQYRSAMLKVMAPELQSRLWQDQLTRFLATHPNLNAEQRAFVNYAMNIANPENFKAGAKPPEICEQIGKLFPKADERKWFSKLGSVIKPAFAVQSKLIAFTEGLRSAVAVRAADNDCTCAGLGICECGLLDSCRSGDCNQVDDCGCIFVGTCTKSCGFLLDLN
jgi:hypothetical protein